MKRTETTATRHHSASKFKVREESEKIELLRGGSLVSSLASAQGGGVRETRLTASLGYLIALQPDVFAEYFGFEGKPRAVRLENHHDTGRSDILVETTRGVGIVEAKVDTTNPASQAAKYGGTWHALLTRYRPTRSDKKHANVSYHTWQELTDRILHKLAGFNNYKIRFVANDLREYLQEHNMIPKKDTVEVYAREINNEHTLALFLQARLYTCKYEQNSRLPKALYFAPHFGMSIADRHPGVHVGISYVARIAMVEIIDTWDDFQSVLWSRRGKPWYARHSDRFEHLSKSAGRYSMLLLDEPRLVFNPPIKKDNLQKGKGWLSKRFLSFDDLFKAWRM